MISRQTMLEGLTMIGNRRSNNIMKNSRILILLAAGTLLLAGCQKNGLFSGIRAVEFTATANYAAGTKTEYSGLNASGTAVQSGQVERIDWTPGDKIRIWSDKAEDRYHTGRYYADYKIWGEIITNGIRSEVSRIVNADIDDPDNDPGVPDPQASENDNVNGLVWEADGPYSFWAIYPNTGTISGNTNSVTYSIPGSQAANAEGKPNMDYAFMLAAKTGVAKGAAVDLDFYPAFTAFEISISADTRNAADIQLTSVEVQSDATTPLAGDVTANVAAAGASTYEVASGANTISYTFPDNTIIATGTDAEPVTFTIFAVPQTIKGMTLVFALGDGTTKTAKLTQGADKQLISFDACKKHRLYGIAMPEGDWPLYLVADTQQYDQFDTFTW